MSYLLPGQLWSSPVTALISTAASFLHVKKHVLLVMKIKILLRETMIGPNISAPGNSPIGCLLTDSQSDLSSSLYNQEEDVARVPAPIMAVSSCKRRTVLALITGLLLGYQN
jgi:hypothetical protein